tara:strand:- start:3140 stop:4396 length:1257 start_codon:yes stop_codon:yes gene_type:complete
MSGDETQSGDGPAGRDLDLPPEALLHPRGYSADLPVTGAWQLGDPVGDRRFHSVGHGRPFALEGGGILPEVTMAYETWGELSSAADNAVLVCHALTGDSHAHGSVDEAHSTPGWWNGVIGPGCGLDTDRYFVVCVNVLGGCQGSTGPATVDPGTGRPYASAFPPVTVRDMVRCQAAVADHLGINRWLGVVGGSMGGMQALEWAVMYPERVRSVAPIATALAASAWQIAWSAAGRTALAIDPRFRDGDYYDAAPGDGPHAGLAVARSIAQIHYRSGPVFGDRFGRELVDPRKVFDRWDRFQVESYLDYQGEKLVRRFDANSYILLNRAMDLHDVARDRGSLAKALARLAPVPFLTLSITSDILYPEAQQVDLRDAIRAAGGRCDHHVVQSPDGHDGFLLATDEVGRCLGSFLEEIESNG